MLRRLACLWLVAIPMHAFGWGALGHRVTAELAYRNLNAQARTACDQILSGESFVDVASWADRIRPEPEWRHVAPYHYANVPDGSDYLKSVAALSPGQQKRGDMVMAILKSETRLRNGHVPIYEKAWALKFLIHLIGDLHQPLHSGRPEDKGGNQIQITWFGVPTNLHSLWDDGMIQSAHAGQFVGLTPEQRSTWYATYLEKQFPWGSSSKLRPDLAAWLNASLMRRAGVYIGYEDSSKYLNRELPELEKQLAYGGYHLAHLLNDIFSGPTDLPKSEQTLRSAIDLAIGQVFENLIFLSPMN